MSVTLVGGMDRLRASYLAAAMRLGHNLKVLSKNEANFMDKAGTPDLYIVFTNKISHEARRKAKKLASAKNIPIKFVHSCGVSTLEECLSALNS
ncbi:MAG: DUF2325 domain-containing protein [Desulfovibrio sp.]|nr:DUF2325 domain-containing protein [Desulfovibrio sp.]